MIQTGRLEVLPGFLRHDQKTLAFHTKIMYY